MRLDALKLRNVGQLAHVDLDFAAMPGVLVAVVGTNGAGKSTLLEAIAFALDREGPTRGKLANMVTAPDSFVEVAISSGLTWTIRQTCSSATRKGEALVRDAAGVPALPTTSVKAFATWRAKNLPSSDVLFASTLAAQGKGGLLELEVGDRRKVLLRAIGIEHYEALAAIARTDATETRAQLATLAARIGDEQRRIPDGLFMVVCDLSPEAATQALATARAALAAGERTAALAQAARERAVVATRERQALERRLSEARARVVAAETQRLADAALLARAPEIRAAVARLTVLSAEEANGKASALLTEQRAETEERTAGDFERQAIAARARKRAAEERVAARRKELEGRLAKVGAERLDLEKRIAANRDELLGRADAIRAACARAEAIGVERATIAQAVARLQAEETAANDRGFALTKHAADADGVSQKAEDRATAARKRLAHSDAVDAAIAELEGLDLEPLKRAAREAEAEVERSQERASAATAERIPKLRGALEEIATEESA